MGCVYAIINLKTNKKYIGSTKNLQKRKSKHLSLLRTGKHHSLSLQAAFKKYGADNFTFAILKDVENSELRGIEQEFLDKFKTYDKKYGYNMSKDSTFPTTTYRRVLQFTLTGKFIGIHTDCVSASEIINCSSSGISSCCRGKYRFYMGFLWFYENEFSEEKLNQKVLLANTSVKRTEKTKELQRQLKLGKKLTETHKLACSVAHKGKTPSNLHSIQQSRRRGVIVTSISGEFIEEFESISQCRVKYPGCEYQLQGKLKNPRKYLFSYKN